MCIKKEKDKDLNLFLKACISEMSDTIMLMLGMWTTEGGGALCGIIVLSVNNTLVWYTGFLGSTTHYWVS